MSQVSPQPPQEQVSAQAVRTAEELDRMHDAVVARFPGGLTPKQFAIVTLESADEDGRVYPHAVADFFKKHSMLITMCHIEGLLEPGWHRHDQPMWWKITQKGREWLAAQTNS